MVLCLSSPFTLRARPPCNWWAATMRYETPQQTSPYSVSDHPGKRAYFLLGQFLLPENLWDIDNPSTKYGETAALLFSTIVAIGGGIVVVL